MYFNNLTLARRLEDAEQASTVEYATTQAQLRPEFACADTRIGDGLAVYVGPNSPINRIYGLGMHAPVAEAMLDEVEDFFASPRDACQRGPMPPGRPVAYRGVTAAELRDSKF